MNNWTDLEQRFLNVNKRFESMALEYQKSYSGERIGPNMSDGSAESREFMNLCSLAGKLLERSLEKKSKYLKIENNTTRWFKFMLENSGAYSVNFVAEEKDQKTGEKLSDVTHGSIQRFPKECANMCLRLESERPLRDERKFFQKLYDDYGKQIIIGTILIIITAIVSTTVGVVFGGNQNSDNQTVIEMPSTSR